MDKTKECASKIVNNSHVIGLFSGLAEHAICAAENHIMSTAQKSMNELSPVLGFNYFLTCWIVLSMSVMSDRV